MNVLLLLDNKIREDQLAQVKREVAELYKNHCGITIKFFEEWRDFSNVPKEWYDAEAEGIKKSYIAEVAKEVYARYAEEIDNLVFFIHRDHWNLTGVWGWNLSQYHQGYSVQQCRFDSRNVANSIGTLYHEFTHDHDTFIYIYNNVRIAPLVGVKDWDGDFTHGGRFTGNPTPFKYIRHKENAEALSKIASELKKAYEKRRVLFLKKQLSLLQQILRLKQQLEVLYRQRTAATIKSDIAIKPKNVCRH
jgi:hypothetical protein